MAAVLTSTGVTFGDSTSLNSKYGIIPQTSSLTFYQSSAPTGWTQVTTHNDKALRVVSGTGAGFGGTNSFSSTFGSKSISATVPVTINGLANGATAIDVNTMAIHAHPANTGGTVGVFPAGPSLTPAIMVASSGNTGNYGNSGSHSHPITYTSASGPLSTSVDFSVQYIDIIYCTFN